VGLGTNLSLAAFHGQQEMRSVAALQNRSNVRKTNAAGQELTIKVEIVLDPVHFCISAVEGCAKALNLMANLLRNARGMQDGMNLA
jgi:hypothetical protein